MQMFYVAVLARQNVKDKTRKGWINRLWKGQDDVQFLVVIQAALMTDKANHLPNISSYHCKKIEVV